MAKRKSLHVNGRSVSVGYDDPAMPLLYALRDELGLKGPRFGCGLGQCGACTVHVDGAAVRSCVTPVSTIGDQEMIVTLEGLGTGAKLHPLQKAFIEEQALQCGYCINGMIMQAAALLASKQRPSEDEIKNALADNLCRCGSHSRIVRAVTCHQRCWRNSSFTDAPARFRSRTLWPLPTSLGPNKRRLRSASDLGGLPSLTPPSVHIPFPGRESDFEWFGLGDHQSR